MTKYYFDTDSRFVINQYNRAKPFASFLPGLAGTSGKPMWVFYVNRGQGIASFGIRDKDGAIMEFRPAVQAYKEVPHQGFRTFIKHDRGWYEPFSGIHAEDASTETMAISPNGLEIKSVNEANGFEVTVTYFTLPGDSFPALVRRVSIRNIGEGTRAIEVLDGMPELLPYGISNGGYKEIANTLKAWMDVYQVESGVPYYKLRGDTADSAEVGGIDAGHFYLSFEWKGDKGELLQPIVDSELVFGRNTSLATPDEFLRTGLSDILAKPQVTTNKIPSGFSGMKAELAQGGTLEFCTIIGHTARIDTIMSRIGELSEKAYIERKAQEAAQLVEELTSDVQTHTSNRMFDAYCKQNYLDNLLRGGQPVVFEAGDKSFVYHLYSRKHGDLERDYNFFSLDPSYYSQGNGNFRDANQNRRNDVLLHPEVGDFNVVMFMSLIQADGYNPLAVQGCSFTLRDLDAVTGLVGEQHRERLAGFFKKTYTPGKLLSFIEDHGIQLSVTPDEFLTAALSHSEQQVEAVFGEGYWIDHWTYNMDLIDNYLAVYPDRMEELLFGTAKYRYFESPAIVVPRSSKYVLAGEGKVRQYGALEESKEKEARIHARKEQPNWVRLRNGEGEIYETNLYEKLVHLALMKFATLDPQGIGVEMEAGKPGWNDSLNGLPGLFASGFSELAELYRVLQFISTNKGVGPAEQSLPVEVADLLIRVDSLLQQYEASDKSDAASFAYWDQVSEAREQYREQVKFGFRGEFRTLSKSEIDQIMERFLNKAQEGFEKAMQIGGGVVPTYFYYEPTSYETIRGDNGELRTDASKRPYVRVNGWKRVDLPYFLEGPTRAMKILPDVSSRRRLYEGLKKTEVYDRKLKMYKVNAPLAQVSHEIGRSRAFTPGWLENESVFLHMAYKYVLELIKGGLYDEYYEEIQSALVPFMDPEVYGRSTLENSSFIASSANPDPAVHGTGFVARLSGSTAEFLSMWNIMMWGKRPFTAQDGQLKLSLQPKLAGWLFDDNGTVSAKFLGSTEVVYRNAGKKNTYGENAASVQELTVTLKDGRTERISGDAIVGKLAEAIRNKEAVRIEAVLN